MTTLNNGFFNDFFLTPCNAAWAVPASEVRVRPVVLSATGTTGASQEALTIPPQKKADNTFFHALLIGAGVVIIGKLLI